MVLFTCARNEDCNNSKNDFGIKKEFRRKKQIVTTGFVIKSSREESIL
jgi:hypothetical protein